MAAVTTWYAGYYDAWLSGQYFKKVEALHAEYGKSGSIMTLEYHNLNVLGPIVRINPDELHVSDLDFIDEIFSGPSKKRDKHALVGKVTLRKSVTVPCLDKRYSHQCFQFPKQLVQQWRTTSIVREEQLSIHSFPRLASDASIPLSSGPSRTC